MRKSFKAWSLVCVIVLCLSVLAACGSNNGNSDKPTGNKENNLQTNAASNPSSNSSSTTTPETTSDAETAPATLQPLRVGIEAEPKSMDPYNATDGNSTGVQGSMFESLLKLDPDMNIQPSLATEYQLSPDAKSITFTIRPNVKFHDGSVLTAQAVKDSLDYVRDEANELSRASFFSFIDSITVSDNQHVTITSKEPNSAMAAYMTHSAASILSPEIIKKAKADKSFNLDRNPVGTGPYKFAEWKDGQYVKVVPFDDYWDTEHKAKLESITYVPVKEASTRVNMIKTGELDIVKNVPSQSAKELSDDASLDLSKTPSMDVFYVGANNKLKQYNLDVRQAMNYALDKEQLIAQVENGYGRIADSAIAPNVVGYSAQKPYEFDLAKAKELMKKGGYENGFNATLWTRNDTEFVAIAENVSIQLAKIGIKAKVVPMESGTLFDKLDAGKDIDMYIGRWSPGTGEADWGLRPNFHSTRIPPSYNNDTFYINPEVDKLLDEALQTADKAKAQEAYDKVQKIVYEDAAWLYLMSPESIVAKRKNVSNVVLLPTGYVDVNNATKE